MSRVSEVRNVLRELKPVLIKKYHISSIGLFGSLVRDDFNEETSDIDILVDFSRPIGIEFVDLAYFIEKKLNKKIDLVSRKGIKEKYLAQIEREILYV